MENCLKEKSQILKYSKKIGHLGKVSLKTTSFRGELKFCMIFLKQSRSYFRPQPRVLVFFFFFFSLFSPTSFHFLSFSFYFLSLQTFLFFTLLSSCINLLHKTPFAQDSHLSTVFFAIFFPPFFGF